MTSSGILPAYPDQGKEKAGNGGEMKGGGAVTNRTESLDDIRVSLSSGGGTSRDTTHRRLKARHIQLIGIGGTIGTVLYVRIILTYLHSPLTHLLLNYTVCLYDILIFSCYRFKLVKASLMAVPAVSSSLSASGAPSSSP